MSSESGSDSGSGSGSGSGSRSGSRSNSRSSRSSKSDDGKDDNKIIEEDSEEKSEEEAKNPPPKQKIIESPKVAKEPPKKQATPVKKDEPKKKVEPIKKKEEPSPNKKEEKKSQVKSDSVKVEEPQDKKESEKKSNDILKSPDIKPVSKNEGSPIRSINKSPGKKRKKVTELTSLQIKEIMIANGVYEQGEVLPSYNVDMFISLGYTGEDVQRFLDQLAINKDAVESVFELAMLLFKSEAFEKAEKLFMKSLERDSKYKTEEVYEKLGDIQSKHYNDLNKAIDFYNKSYALIPSEILCIKIGRCYERLNDYDKALEQYKLSYEKNPKIVWGMFHIGCLLAKMNNPESLSYLKKAYELDKDNVDIIERYCNELVKSDAKEEVNKGIEILEKAKDFYIGNVEILSSLAIGYNKNNRLKDSIALLESVANTKAFQKDEYKVYQLAYYYEKNKNYAKAIEFFQNLYKLNKTNIKSLLHLGVIFKNITEYRRAFKCFEAVLKLDPSNVAAHHGIGQMFQILGGNDDDAISHLEKCIELNDKSLKSYIHLGIIYLRNKNLTRAKYYLDKAIALDENNVLTLATYANLEQQLKNYENAESYLKKALAIDSKNIYVNTSYGDILFSVGKYDEAIKKYERVIKMKEIAEVYFSLGHCYYLLEQYHNAVKCYTNALSIKKNTRHDYYYYLGGAMLGDNRQRDAVKCYKCAVRLCPRKALYHYSLGLAYLSTKKFDKSVKSIERAIRMSEAFPDQGKDVLNMKEVNLNLFKAYFNLPNISAYFDKCQNLINDVMNDDPNKIEYLELYGGLQEKMGKHEDAINTFNKILSMDPKNEKAKAGLERVME